MPDHIIILNLFGIDYLHVGILIQIVNHTCPITISDMGIMR